MSMNLHCKEFNVPDQIGTYDTYIILSANEKGNPDGGWKGVVRRLRLYWERVRQDDFNHYSTDPEQQADVNAYFERKVARLEKALAENKVLHFYYL